MEYAYAYITMKSLLSYERKKNLRESQINNHDIEWFYDVQR
jgi:hypothetical protein